MNSPAVNQFDKTVNNTLSPLTRDSGLSDMARLLILVFAAKIVPPLPQEITSPFNNTLVRILAVFLVLWMGNKNPTRSILLATGFIVAINLLSNRGPFESPSNEGFGLLANIHDPDIYYMKNRAKHEADYRERSLTRRHPNRVHAIVQENNERAREVLLGDSDENANGMYSINSVTDISF